MRVGLISPYSYTYPGGVGRHVEALAEELLRQGHDLRLMAPFDPDDRHAWLTHRGSRPQRRPLPDYLVPLGRTVAIRSNGSIANLALSASGASTLDRELRQGRYDVIHVHEPNAPFVGWIATEHARTPLVATFHAYSTDRVRNIAASQLLGMRRLYSKLHVRIAVSDAARWTAERFYGGRYRVIPNGVDLRAANAAASSRREPGEPLRVLFVGRADERKGLAVLLRAFESVRSAGIAARLVVAGTSPADVGPLLLDDEGVELAGRVSEDEKWRLLREADVLCAPSLGGESFGMVLTEAFAAGTPVVCSDIAGYRDVVRDGVEGVIVAPGEPVELARALAGLALDEGRRARMAEAARRRAERFAWPAVACDVTRAYADAVAAPEPTAAVARVGARLGLTPAAGARVPGPSRIASLDSAAARGATARRRRRAARRVAVGTGSALGLALAGLALQRIGIDTLAGALLVATPVWVLTAFALMCTSMLFRAEAWHAILRAALPTNHVRRRDAAVGTMIGVLMSATLPARLGEPSRAFIVARRLGRVRERLPVVLGTLVSQSLLNVLALSILGATMFATVGLFKGDVDALVIGTIAPVVLLAVMLAAPGLFHNGRPSRSARFQQLLGLARGAVVEMRRGLEVFRRPRVGAWAAAAQLTAWTIQWLACYVLLVALGLDHSAGVGAAAAVLFAVNVTAVLPAIPSNIGVFQAACVAVLSAYGVGKTDALAYGIILQTIEIATAFALGMPALVGEGLSWRDMRLRALNAAPVELAAARRRRDVSEAEA